MHNSANVLLVHVNVSIYHIIKKDSPIFLVTILSRYYIIALRTFIQQI